MLAEENDTRSLMGAARQLRDKGFGSLVSYSPKVFIPLTRLCRDVCHYCTFATTPKHLDQPYMPVDEVLAVCREGQALGCTEALITLGERPELRYRAAREALAEMGFSSTLDYVAQVAGAVLTETTLLPHINAGCMSVDEMAMLRPVCASMGLMLESASERLCERGMPHFGSPDKAPEPRLASLECAGQLGVPFTSGILMGIGETRRERIEALLALRESHLRWGQLQEVIIQNFRAKTGTKMAAAPEPDLAELCWTIAVSRLVLGPDMSLQAPPNLSPGVLGQLLDSGINDWGGVSPLTQDHVNPEAPWPHLDQLARDTAQADKVLVPRLTVYPQYLRRNDKWLDKAVLPAVLAQADGQGLGRGDHWITGAQDRPPAVVVDRIQQRDARPRARVKDLVERCLQGDSLSEQDIVALFEARGEDFFHITQKADEARRQRVGDRVGYVVNRNVNYTNLCNYGCTFCAFSKAGGDPALRGKPYDISAQELARRTDEAWQRGATEICLQGGIHPAYTGQTYLDIVATVRSAAPDIHIHAFSPLEIWQGANTLGLTPEHYLERLRKAGLGSLPGTAAEVLDDEVRAILCPDKLNTAQWLSVIEAAHRQGLPTTATMMFGHVDNYQHWARHFLAVRKLQQRYGGFTEFVPLPFVAAEAPIYRRGKSRRGPTFREAVLVHAVARLVFFGLIDNIQGSWVKMGREGVSVCLQAGVSDLGGTLMNESITRAAGTVHGQEWHPADMVIFLDRIGRKPWQRSTLYKPVSDERIKRARQSGVLIPVTQDAAGKKAVDKSLASTRHKAPEFSRRDRLV